MAFLQSGGGCAGGGALLPRIRTPIRPQGGSLGGDRKSNDLLENPGPVRPNITFSVLPKATTLGRICISGIVGNFLQEVDFLQSAPNTMIPCLGESCPAAENAILQRTAPKCLC